MELTRKELKAFYESYNGPKCFITTYYNRVYSGIPMEEAVSPKKYQSRRQISCKKSFYDSYNGKKCSLTDYYRKIRVGLTYEEAVKPNTPETIALIHPKREHRFVHPQSKVKELHSEKKKKYTKSDYLIEITYQPDEAKVFHRKYRDMIEELEEKISQEENYATVQILDSKLNQIKQEYLVFCEYNPLNK